MLKMSFKLKLLMFFHKYLNISAKTICKKANISRATFYRYKKKLDSGRFKTQKR